MSFTIPNQAVAGYPQQAAPDTVDIAALVAALDQTGVVSGCAVTAHGGTMSVDVAAGTVVVAGVTVTVSSVSALTVGAAGSSDRKDIVVVNSSGTVSVVAGTASAPPVLKPAIPASSVLLAEVYVPAGLSAVVAGNITDKTVVVPNLNGSYLHVAGPANGSDDTTAIQALLTAARLAGGGVVKGLPGEAYKISAPLVVGSLTRLDMTGCTVTLLAGSNCNMVNNYALGQARSFQGASITSGLAVLTTTASQFSAGDAGKNVLVYGAGPAGGPLTTTILSYTSATSVTLAANAVTTVTGQAVCVGTRDVRPSVVGGSWDRGANGGTTKPDERAIRFRRCDGPIVQDATVTVGGTADGKNAVSFGDVTDLRTSRVTTYSTGDGVHLLGPIYGGLVENTTGLNTDDGVALTPNDYDLWNDTQGDILGVTIRDTATHHTAGGVPVKVLGSPGWSCKHILVEGVTGDSVGYSTGYLVRLGDDNSSANTTGGWLDHITVRNVKGRLGFDGGHVNITATNAGRIVIDGVDIDDPVFTNAINLQPTSAGTVDSLTIRNITCGGSVATGSTIVYLGNTVTVHALTIDGVFGTIVNSVDLIGLGAAATVSRAVLSHVNCTGLRALLVTAAGAVFPTLEIAASSWSSAWTAILNSSTEIHLTACTATFSSGLIDVAGGTAAIYHDRSCKFSGTVTTTVTGGTLATTRAKTASVATYETTTSTTYTDLATVGPSVAIDVPASGTVLVTIAADLYLNTAGYCFAGFVMSGANTLATPADTDRIYSSTVDMGLGKSVLVTGLTPGTTTFKMVYHVDSGTGRFGNRKITASPL